MGSLWARFYITLFNGNELTHHCGRVNDAYLMLQLLLLNQSRDIIIHHTTMRLAWKNNQ
ncbi:hypothetical protein K6Y31_14440 [Motilimonas cestriensis]|uniref:Uncharacterized protein n=1 Tax=Motilimonas cestriensis TaxID=2742685 RepID=A0ABS8WBU8_9GAMM|nr:hypothetical protein [Motilimonas cestriensis]MCE2596008.1 hypothetical protein [Motilimonas cestriensis]